MKNLPTIEVASHKKKLKLLLLQSLEKKSAPLTFSFMPFFKKYFAVLTLIVLVFTAAITKNWISQQTVNAQEIVDQAIQNLTGLEEHTLELSQKISILNEARNAEDLNYEGEEEFKSGKKFQKISFTDNGVKQIIYIDVNDTTQSGVILPYIASENSVYFYGDELGNADSATIQAISYSYLKDKKAVYFNGNKVDGADPKTFVVINEPFAKDKNAVYFAESKILGADPDSFEAVSDLEVHPKDLIYGKDKNAVYSYTGQKLENIDPATFEVIYQNIYRDKNGIYKDGIKILDNDASNAEIEAFYEAAAINENPLALNTMYSYSKDKKSIYFDTRKIEDADVESFEVFTKEFNELIDYGKDKNAVYWAGDKIEGADPKTFKILSDGYGKDRTSVYYFTEKFNVDYKTFEILGYSYVKDKNGIYREARKLPMDSATFEILGLDSNYSPTYVKDKNGVYYIDTEIKDADLKTFKVMKDQPYASDKNHIYFNGEVLN